MFTGGLCRRVRQESSQKVAHHSSKAPLYGDLSARELPLLSQLFVFSFFFNFLARAAGGKCHIDDKTRQQTFQTFEFPHKQSIS